MKKKRLLIYIFILVLALPGTVSAKRYLLKKKPKEQNLSIVFGYIDMDKAPTKLKWIDMKRLRPRTKTPYYSFNVHKGFFYRAHVPYGTYKFISFGGSKALGNKIMKYSFPSQGKGELDRVIRRQGVYFVGAYKYKKIKTKFFKPKKYDLIKVNTITEKEFLQKLLTYTKHPEWIRLIKIRQQQLR